MKIVFFISLLLIFNCFASQNSDSGSKGGSSLLSGKIDNSIEVEEDVQKVSEKINKLVIKDTTVTAYRLLVKNQQVFSASKQKELLTINKKGMD